MENKSSSNQLVFCKVCKKTVKLTFEHYKKCNKQSNFKIFYFDIKNKSNKWKKEGQVQKSCHKPSLMTISSVYSIHPLEVSIFDNLKYTRFSSLDHLTSYIVYSNKVPFSQFIFHLVPELKSIPQIKSIIAKNIRKVIGKASEQDNIIQMLPTAGSGLELLNKPWFWADLIRLYVLNYSGYAQLFNFDIFDPSKIPQTLLIPIYYTGYKYREHKPSKLTEYMERLFDYNFKKVIYSPSLSNLQALYIYMNDYFGSGKISLSRACLARITRMSYTLGIHIDTSRFGDSLNFERKNLFREISAFDTAFSGSFKLKYNCIPEPPVLDPNLYKLEKYLVPDSLTNCKYSNSRLNSLKAAMNSLKKIYGNKTIELIRFDLITATNDIELEKICIDRLSSLERAYIDLAASISRLKVEYREYAKDINDFENEFHPSRFHVALIILEYGRINQFHPSQVLLQKTLDTCDNMLNYFELNPGLAYFYYYLICFTYLSLIKLASSIEKVNIITRVNKIFNTLKPPDEFNNLNYLMLATALKTIHKK
ncbi:hypothetical protein CONCODRAFT_7323 [Conidiobolus coronatus NRRL 28638]|uniref:Transcription factor domain-containing protein n=1 Tax=Conidiobolus coronatus (strain ATCC 28846 / CBS 209.66 / NRRL 28638) TaxID=796925 RepID=A0A137P5F0_CONC2|nr:hypothetical protein CONCODRAFT_7323 [Conidiobolus coronatus NRRL 28638]|eukprot:KXN70179.1 hypothetical protein CONCODRAFT_7323 [Conidiobolus coronatus NRRL 28638]